MGHRVGSLQAIRALQRMGGKHKNGATKKRRISITDFAKRIGVSKNTVISLEKGEAGVSVGTLTMACLVLGEVDRIANLMDVRSDETGLMLDKQSLPKRIDGPRKTTNRSQSSAPTPSTDDDSGGVSF